MAIMPKEGHLVTEHELMLEIEKIVAYLENDLEVNQILSPTYPIQYLNKSLRNDKMEYFKIPESPKRYDYLLKQLKNSTLSSELNTLIADDGGMARISGRLVDPGSMAMLERHRELKDFISKEINTNLLDYRITGTPVIIDKGGREISRTIIIGLLFAFALIAFSMGLLFKSVKMAFLSLVPNVFPIILTAGFIGYSGIDLNMSTAIVFTIAFGIAVDDTIHFLSRYRQEIQMGRSNLFAVRRTFISTGKAITITTIVLLGGFVSLLFSDFLSTYYIGLFVSMTLLFALLTDLSLLPLLLLKKNQSSRPRK
jgi:predicted RND superfamily exporter protein